ncbi:hypothetical protein B0T22DRAFT_161578 [Podospora appendiculata]|uniref:Uncharacterized protein n=1 Tax=Podospora appendiculata TaxID=314037 RepID=A0AAE1CCP8_9PEZI|nr:hypothetical protein B0T22DRAFT_161578 [Podospora appendiculata]
MTSLRCFHDAVVADSEATYVDDTEPLPCRKPKRGNALWRGCLAATVRMIDFCPRWMQTASYQRVHDDLDPVSNESAIRVHTSARANGRGHDDVLDCWTIQLCATVLACDLRWLCCISPLDGMQLWAHGRCTAGLLHALYLYNRQGGPVLEVPHTNCRPGGKGVCLPGKYLMARIVLVCRQATARTTTTKMQRPKTITGSSKGFRGWSP